MKFWLTYWRKFKFLIDDGGNVTITTGKLDINTYIDLTDATTRPPAVEGVFYYNATAGFKMLQFYNSTDWVLTNGTMIG